MFLTRWCCRSQLGQADFNPVRRRANCEDYRSREPARSALASTRCLARLSPDPEDTFALFEAVAIDCREGSGTRVAPGIAGLRRRSGRSGRRTTVGRLSPAANGSGVCRNRPLRQGRKWDPQLCSPGIANTIQESHRRSLLGDRGRTQSLPAGCHRRDCFWQQHGPWRDPRPPLSERDRFSGPDPVAEWDPEMAQLDRCGARARLRIAAFPVAGRMAAFAIGASRVRRYRHPAARCDG